MITLFDFPEILIEQVQIADEITFTGRVTSPTACCPECGTVATHIQSHYSRTLHDLPSSGHPVHLILDVRRFFCKKGTCRRKIFTEQLSKLFSPHAQRTKRLQEALYQLGQAVGGQSGARLGRELGISGSRDTLLRLLRRQEAVQPIEARIIGLDDWAWKRGLRYGTLICDLERGLPLDVLPDRSIETVATWLQAHPSVTLVSRDRSTEYAAAIRKGAPQATQVADRWHLAKNLAECVETLLGSVRTEIRRAGHTSVSSESMEEEHASPRPASSSRKEEQARAARRAQHLDQYEQVVTLRTQGVRNGEIAKRMKLSSRTIGRWLNRGHAPESKSRRKRASRIDAYQTYILKRWQQGCHNGIQLYQELKAKGFRGSERGVYRYLTTLRPSTSPRGSRGPAPSPESIATLSKPISLEHFSARQATWLFLRKLSDLDEKEQESLLLIRIASPKADVAYQLVTAFMHMLRERTGEQLESWLEQVQASQLSEFEPFVTSIRRDRAAVFAGLTLPWSNGPLEGNVNRLKLIKRSMYGRAKFDLLRLRVLHHPKTTHEVQHEKTDGEHQRRRGSPKKLSTRETISTSQHTTLQISRVA